MVLKIIWSPQALSTYIAILEYLEKEWSDKEVNNFISRVNEKLALLITQPRLGRITNKKTNLYRTVLHKRVTLVYVYQPNKKEIELVTFWNNWNDPNKFIG